ncbi:MAG: Sulfatase, partial [Streptococcus parasanguinis DORA_23_24]
YVDDEYKKAFPNENRDHVSLDKIPFFIYYKGVSSQTIDVNGKNSLNMTPTVLDFLDYSSTNYFLGTSLFSQDNNDNMFSSIYSEGTVLKKTSGSKVEEIPESELKMIKENVYEYFRVSQNKN